MFYDIRFMLSDSGKEIPEVVEKIINDRFENEKE